MACPYFYPEARLENGPWVVPPRLPLGDAYIGKCRAGASAFQPEEMHVRQVCNSGYGRGCCDRFPENAPHDAVRFHVAEDSGGLIRIRYVFEKECWPRDNGILECAAVSLKIHGTADEILRSQALAFAGSYLRLRELARNNYAERAETNAVVVGGTAATPRPVGA
ncbi:MAG TPA: hypothetical protein VKX49_24615 [Bryobacteraceae bacterium]|nr:hypothetical protein [Bryobacteraceae bacterium]